jgi:hypothetical protein
MSPGVHTALELALSLAGTVHGGSLAAFALLLIGRKAIPYVDDIALVRVYRAWGAGIGLSLGLFWLTYATLWPSAHNPGATTLLDRFAIPTDPSTDLGGVQLALLLFYWINYVILEIWTLEPCRLLDRNGTVTDPAAYAATTQRVTLHLAFNAVIFNLALLVGVL